MHEDLGLLTKTRSSGLLPFDGSGIDQSRLERTKADGRSKVEILILDHAGRDQFGLVTRVGDRDLTNEGGFLSHTDQALDGELLAFHERGNAALGGSLKSINKLVLLTVNRHDRGNALARWVENCRVFRSNNVGITAQEEKIVALLHGSKTGTRNDNRGGTVEAFNSGTHGSFELDNLLGGVILGINSLAVLDHGEGDEPSGLVHNLLELVKTDPKVVSVEELVLGDILEVGLVFIGAHGTLAEDQVLVRVADGEVAALLVVFGTLAAFHHERRIGRGKVGQDLEIKRSAEVVGVGNEHVLHAVGKKGIETTRSNKGGVQITMAGRAPLIGGVVGILGRLEGRGIELGDLVLEHFQSLLGGKVGILLLEESEGVVAGGEGVHEHKLDVAAEGLAHLEDLLGSQIEEGIVAFDLEQ